MSMRFFKNLSIKRKQTLIIMLTCGIALLIACLTLATFEVLSFRRAMVSNLSTLAAIIGNTSTAALDFNDPKSAEQALAALRAEPSILGAGIYSKEGQVFAAYDRPDDNMAFVPPSVPAKGWKFQGNALVLFQPILSNGEQVGVVYVESDLRALYSRLRQYLLVMLVVLLAASVLALVLSARLQHIISGPILHLVQTARSITQEKNYALRATKTSNDELGVLVENFNEMLAQIQVRDGELERSRDALEQRVQERTTELAAANVALQQENMERKRAEESMRLLSSAIEQSADNVLVTGRDGIIKYANPAFLQLTGFAREEVIGQTTRILKSNEHSPAFYKDLWETILSGKSFRAEFVNRKKSGELYSEEKTITPVLDSAGQISHFVASGRDVTERKRTEAELDALNKQLLETSRRAGMAEVASNVLHNVGNVLNSVNVSAALLADRIRGSKISSLVKATALMREHSHDLPIFLAEDPKGRQLPGFLIGVVDNLANEQAGHLKELESLGKNIDHIKDIVAMQQSYAKVSGVCETVAPVELIEDAVRMNAAAFARHEVQLIREYSEVPRITVEKHKVLQILVNLMRNAKYALDEGGKTEKPMRLILDRKDEGFIRISICDDGVGIPAENLTRIFNHGFTTRKTGHGFGLHSGALAAKELGGSLSVHSEGRGKGATFTLELPCPNALNVDPSTSTPTLPPTGVAEPAGEDT